MARCLEGPSRHLAGLVSISNFLAVDTVCRSQRACGRLIVEKNLVTDLQDAIRELGIWCHDAPFRFTEGKNLVTGTTHAGSFTTIDHEDARAVLYFGLNETLARGAEQADLHEEHSLLGQLFGYPECCVRAFEGLDRHNLDKLPATIPHTGPFPALMNPVIPYLYPGWSLLFHFACSPACRPSLGLAESRFAQLCSLAPEAMAFEEVSSGISLYGETIGIGLVRDYSAAAPDEFDCREIMTRSQQTVAALSSCGTGRMRMLGPHRFAFGERLFDAGHQFAARFEAPLGCSGRT